jgi:hypothetical protein
MSVLCQGVRGCASPPQLKAGSTTTHLGTFGALSRSSKERSPAASPMR